MPTLFACAFVRERFQLANALTFPAFLSFCAYIFVALHRRGVPLDAAVWTERVSEVLAFSLHGPRYTQQSDSPGRNAYFWASIQGAELVESELLLMWRQLASMEQLTDVLRSTVALPILARIRSDKAPMSMEVAILATTMSSSHLTGCVIQALVDDLAKVGSSVAFLVDVANEAFQTALSDEKRLELFAGVVNNEHDGAFLFKLLIDRLAISESTGLHNAVLQFIQWLFKSAPEEDHSALFLSLLSRLENALPRAFGLEALHSALLHVDKSCSFFASDACIAIAMQLLECEADAVCRSRFVSPSVGILVNKVSAVLHTCRRRPFPLALLVTSFRGHLPCENHKRERH